MTDQDIISLPPRELCVGMYVLLPKGWLDHPFFRNQFLITTDKQLQTIRACKLDEVVVQLSRSKLPESKLKSLQSGPTDQSHPKSESQPTPQEWNPDNLIPPVLLDALQNTTLEPEVRAQVVYQHSLELMQRLLDSPTAANLRASKKVIGMITDMILSDDQTSAAMLRITNHDFYTYTHSVNVGVISIMLAKALFGQSDAHDMHELGSGFFLHDLGKIAVRPEVINKPGRLTDAEMRHMRTHPYKGFKMLKESEELSEESRIIILQHHERTDGTGYPKQLHGDEIHIYGKICCIADVYDALTAERSYKKALKPFDALMLMRDKMSDHFDKELFTQFVQLMR